MAKISRKGGWLLFLVTIALGASALFSYLQGVPNGSGYVTATLGYGEIVQEISANGTLNPVTLVNVGTQISGTVQKLLVDHNSAVEAGQVLAELDDRLIRAQMAQHQAQLRGAEAQLRIAELKAMRLRGLDERVSVSRIELDQVQYDIDVAESQVDLVKAQVALDLITLEYTSIRSPVTGVVVDRAIDAGQTVAASFRTPTLFVIAQDLKLMQVDSNVSEADVSAIRIEMPVRFSVDAFPHEMMVGHVRQIRLKPKVQQNVVSYNVVVEADNPEGRLLPGMTAHLRFEVARRPRVLRIPNSALRFRPRGFAGAEPADGEALVFRLVQGLAEPVVVKTGGRDSDYTEMLSGPLRAGDILVVREEAAMPGQREAGIFRFRWS